MVDKPRRTDLNSLRVVANMINGPDAHMLDGSPGAERAVRDAIAEILYLREENAYLREGRPRR